MKISDEPLLKDFFYSLSDQSLYRRFISVRKDMPHERLQEFVVIDYTKEMVILATVQEDAEMEKVVGGGAVRDQRDRPIRPRSPWSCGMIIRTRGSAPNCSPI